MNYTSSRLSIDSTRNSFHLPVITDTRRMKTIPCKINILRDNHVNSCNIRAKDSGRLILGAGASSSIVQPMAGMLVFFSPAMVHEVEKNQSVETRLSIGINFGKAGN